ncbi:dual specificity protein phosphatase family protein [Aquisphaera insulae]|uniref:dual specificity protein phosphatase family protein n=1 Tax=Aquisphaera insulae TaxID=2712864 RepID=UPI0013EC7A98|nr:dual specificity protein phosphatase family protein [Aquisphaera insulae]
MVIRRTLVRRGLLVLLLAVAAQQLWRHGHDYVLPRQFAVVEPGKIFRGGWQKDWPMRRIVRDYKIRTVLALAHPDDHPLSQGELALSKELGFRWIHIPIVDQRIGENPKTISDLLDEAAAVLADPANYPVYFHCHHGLNRASMAQIAYRTKYCGWSLEQAMAEIDDSIGLVKVDHGPDYRHMIDYYNERVLPLRNPAGTADAARPARDSVPAAGTPVPTLAVQVGVAGSRPSVR